MCSGHVAVLSRTAFFMNKTARCYALASNVCSGHMQSHKETAFFLTRMHTATRLLAVCVPGRQRFLLKPLFFYNKIARCYALACNVCSGHVALSYIERLFLARIHVTAYLLAICIWAARGCSKSSKNVIIVLCLHAPLAW